MLIKKILLSSLVLGCAGFFSCTDLSGSSSLGQDIVNNVDPNRTNFDNSFLFSDTAKATAAKSIETPNDTSLGFQKSLIIVGKQSNREAWGSVLFSFDSSFKKSHLKDSLISVSLKFESSNLLTDTTVKVYPTSLQIFDGSTIPLTSLVPLGSATMVAKSDSSYDTISKKIVFKGLVDIELMTPSFKNLFKSTDSSITKFRFLIANKETLFKLSPIAKITFKYKRDTVVDETVTSTYSNYVIFENSTLIAERDPKPITSSETGRRAVFTLDMEQFWKSMTKKTGFNEVLSAALSISASMIPGGDTSIAIPFSYYISPVLLSDVNTIRDSMSSSGTPASINKSDTVSVHVEKYLQRPTSTNQPKMYLYISNRNPNTIQQETIWSEPIITAIFTNTL